jgi:Tfp pilus assembly protein PilN
MNGFNLSTYSYTDKKVALAAYLITVFIVFIFSAYNVSSYLESMRNKDGLLNKVDSIRKEVSSLEINLSQKKAGLTKTDSVKEARKIAKVIDSINAVIKQKSFSWSELFYSLEKATPKGVSIEDIKPNYNAKKVTIRGVATRLKDITRFVDNLKDTAYIKNGFLVSEQESLNKKKQRVLSFEIAADGSF